MRLKTRGSYLTCKVSNKCLNVRERVEVIDRHKNDTLLSTESSMSVIENADRKKRCLK